MGVEKAVALISKHATLEYGAYADVIRLVLELQPRAIFPKLAEESPAFREEFLGLCLRILQVLAGFAESFGPAGERKAAKRYASIQSDCRHQLFTHWSGGKTAVGGETQLHKVLDAVGVDRFVSRGRS